MQGLDNVLRNMRDLDTKVVRRSLNSAIRQGANVVRDSARLKARAIDDPSTPEKIYRNITVRSMNRRMVRSRRGDAGVRVGVLGGAKAPAKKVGELQGKGKGNPGGDTFYWRFLEFGTEKVAAKPILRPAAKESERGAFEATAKQLEKRIMTDVAKMKKT